MAAQSSPIELIIRPRERDLGGFSVRRVLPYASHRMVGPFIFFDHMGPADFQPGKGMDVRPHPHINLATVTYLFEGRIHHRDSLGSNQLIEPGAINWMTAGRGIVHSERTPDAERAKGFRLHGIQLWVALPEEFEEINPSFTHHPKETLPEFEWEGARVKLLLGQAFGHQSPVPIHSDLFYAELRLNSGNATHLDFNGRETALYVVQGQIQINDQEVNSSEMAVLRPGVGMTIQARHEQTLLMALGGSPMGKRHIYWNFISSTEDRIEEAKRLWSAFPQASGDRFTPISGDDHEFIPLPQD